MPLTKQMAKNYTKNIHFLRILRFFFIAAGVFFIAAVIIAFTTLPFWGIHWLGTSKSEISSKPATLILLGGGGMPSESNLIRGWYAVQAARSFTEARVLISMPGDTTDSQSTPRLMKEELISFRTAKLAEKKGLKFNSCEHMFIESLTLKGEYISDKINHDWRFVENVFNWFSRPTQAVLQKWLREEHRFHITIFSSSQESWMFRITKPNQQLEEGLYSEDFESYEKALEEGLYEGLKLINTNGKEEE